MVTIIHAAPKSAFGSFKTAIGNVVIGAKALCANALYTSKAIVAA